MRAAHETLAGRPGRGWHTDGESRFRLGSPRRLRQKHRRLSEVDKPSPGAWPPEPTQGPQSASPETRVHRWGPRALWLHPFKRLSYPMPPAQLTRRVVLTQRGREGGLGGGLRETQKRKDKEK